VRLGIDVIRVAEELSISPAAYEDYESGGRQIPALLLGQIADLFGVQVAWFYRDVGFDIEDEGAVAACVDAPSLFCVATEEQRVRALADMFRRLDLEGQQHLLAIAGALSRSDTEQTGD
jgi:transcriptional regulator with XRE-family HTH domain